MDTHIVSGVKEVTGVFGLGNQLLFADILPPGSSRFTKLNKSDSKIRAASSNTIQTIQLDPYSNEDSALLTAFHSVFGYVQEGAALCSSDEERATFILNCSRRYRSELESYLLRCSRVIQRQELRKEQMLTTVSSTEQNNALNHTSSDLFLSNLRLIETAKSLWHLFEIVHFDPHLNITVQLMDWIHRSTDVPAYLNEVLACYNNNTGEFELPFGREMGSAVYWQCLAQLLVIGRVSDLIKLIQVNDALQSHYGIRDDLIRIILSCPSFGNSDVLNKARSEYDVKIPTHNNFKDTFNAWKNQVASFTAHVSHFKNAPFIGLLALLSGQNEALVASSSCWYEHLVGFLLFCDPFAQKSQLPWLVDRSCQVKTGNNDSKNNMTTTHGTSDGDDSSFSLFDDCLRVILIQPPVIALNALQKVIDLKWFSTHLIDLLVHLAQQPVPLIATALSEMHNTDYPAIIDKLKKSGSDSVADFTQESENDLPFACIDHINESGSYLDLRELILSEYGLSLWNDHWLLAVDYHAYCLNTGLQHIKVLIMSVKPSINNVDMLLNICDKYNLIDESNIICNIVFNTLWNQNQCGHAIYWLLKGSLAKGSLDNSKANSYIDILITLAYNNEVEIRQNARNQIDILCSMISTFDNSVIGIHYIMLLRDLWILSSDIHLNIAEYNQTSSRQTKTRMQSRLGHESQLMSSLKTQAESHVSKLSANQYNNLLSDLESTILTSVYTLVPISINLFGLIENHSDQFKRIILAEVVNVLSIVHSLKITAPAIIDVDSVIMMINIIESNNNNYLPNVISELLGLDNVITQNNIVLNDSNRNLTSPQIFKLPTDTQSLTVVSQNGQVEVTVDERVNDENRILRQVLSSELSKTIMS